MTLTQAAVVTKKGLIIFVVLVILGIAGKIGYDVWYQYYLAHLPPVEEKPEMKFGSLPALIFPAATISSSNYSYSLDTTTGGLPQVPKLIKVFFIPKGSVSLLSPEKAQTLAQKLGFSTGPEIIDSSNYKFTDGRDGSLSMDIITGNFSFQKQIPQASEASATDSAYFINNSLPNQDQLINDYKTFLKNRGLFTKEFENGRTSVIYNSSQPTNAQTAEVSLWPIDIDNLPIVTPLFNQSIISATVTRWADDSLKFAKVNYTFWPIDTTTFSTYPLKTAEQAFADLRGGKGFISIESKNPKVSITSAYLAYYETNEYSPYLQPVFVFEGPNFAALVPAISTNNPSPSLSPTKN